MAGTRIGDTGCSTSFEVVQTVVMGGGGREEVKSCLSDLLT